MIDKRNVPKYCKENITFGKTYHIRAMQLHLIFSNSQKPDAKLDFCGISATMCLSFLRLNIIQIQQSSTKFNLTEKSEEIF